MRSSLSYNGDFCDARGRSLKSSYLSGNGPKNFGTADSPHKTSMRHMRKDSEV
jgi:hypothetical protein